MYWEYTGCGMKYVMFILTCAQSFQQAVAIHNCAHVGPFELKSLNHAYLLFLSLLSGAPASLYVPGHNLSHHRHLETKKDVMRTRQMTFRYNILNIALFAPSIVFEIQKNDMHYMRLKWKARDSIVVRFGLEAIATHVLLVWLLCNDFRKALVVYVLPTLIGKYCIISLNMLQHGGCDPTSKYNHSRNFTNTALNYLLYNNGYHTAHHMFPGCHWSKLPIVHARIQSHIHPCLIHGRIRDYIYCLLKQDVCGSPNGHDGNHSMYPCTLAKTDARLRAISS